MLDRNKVIAVVLFLVVAFGVLVACPPGRAPHVETRQMMPPAAFVPSQLRPEPTYVADTGSSTDSPEIVSACAPPDQKRMLDAISARAYDCDSVIACRLGGTKGLPAAAMRCRNANGPKDYILILYNGTWVASEIR